MSAKPMMKRAFLASSNPTESLATTSDQNIFRPMTAPKIPRPNTKTKGRRKIRGASANHRLNTDPGTENVDQIEEENKEISNEILEKQEAANVQRPETRA